MTDAAPGYPVIEVIGGSASQLERLTHPFAMPRPALFATDPRFTANSWAQIERRGTLGPALQSKSNHGG